ATLLLRHRFREAAALLGRVGQLAKAVGELDAASIDLEALRHPRIIGLCARQRRLWRWVFEQDAQTPLPQMRLDMLDQNLAEDIRPGVVLRDADLAGGRLCKCGPIALVAGNGGKQVDSGEPLKGAGNGQKLR